MAFDSSPELSGPGERLGHIVMSLYSIPPKRCRLEKYCARLAIGRNNLYLAVISGSIVIVRAFVLEMRARIMLVQPNIGSTISCCLATCIDNNSIFDTRTITS